MSRTLIHKTTRPRTILVIAFAVLVAADAAWWFLGRGTDGLQARTVQAGEVTVKLTPLRLDAIGVEIEIALDTHTVPLDLNLESGSRLTVDGKTTDGGKWTGTGPGSHHREGTLRFSTPAPPGASVELSITGLPQVVNATWTAPEA